MLNPAPSRAPLSESTPLQTPTNHCEEQTQILVDELHNLQELQIKSKESTDFVGLITLNIQIGE